MQLTVKFTRRVRLRVGGYAQKKPCLGYLAKNGRSVWHKADSMPSVSKTVEKFGAMEFVELLHLRENLLYDSRPIDFGPLDTKFS